MKREKIIVICIAVFIIIFLLGYFLQIPQKTYILSALFFSFLLMLILMLDRNKKEEYKSNEIVNWIRKIDSSLNDECFQCVESSINKLWDDVTIHKVQKMSEEEQRLILDSLLITDCKQPCIVKNDVKMEDITSWISWLSKNSDLSSLASIDCLNCIVSFCFRSWTMEDLDKVKKMSIDSQLNVIKYILLTDCSSCDIEKPLERKQVELWINSVLTGSKTECYNCIIDMILKLWNQETFAKVKSLSKIGQSRILQALIAVSCQATCVIPTGVDSRIVSKWIQSVFADNKECHDCLLKEIIKRWTEETFEKAKKLKKEDQLILLGTMSKIYCNTPCNIETCKYPKINKYGY